VLVFALFALVACKGASGGSGGAGGAGSEGKGGGGGAGGGAAASAPSLGVKECDDFIAKVEACFAKDPQTKADMEPAFKAQRDAWKGMAQSNKDGAKVACQAALDNFALSYPSCK